MLSIGMHTDDLCRVNRGQVSYSLADVFLCAAYTRKLGPALG
jgi:hypothetical protein